MNSAVESRSPMQNTAQTLNSGLHVAATGPDEISRELFERETYAGQVPNLGIILRARAR